MQPRITVLTLGVSDLDASLRFYRDGLGLPTEGIIGTEFEDGAVVFIEMNAGLRLALFPSQSLATSAGVPIAGSGDPRVSIGHNVGSKEEVDAVMRQAERAGARITKPAEEFPWGIYSGHFLDPDGHLWEIAWNPAWEEDPS